MNEIFWVNGEAGPHLAIVLCPRGGEWLNEELQGMRRGGIETLVSLLEPKEAEFLGLGREATGAIRAGMHFLSFPIPDTHVPSDVTAFRAFIDRIAVRLKAGEHIGVHCRGSIGRATITAACALIHLGWEPRAALEAIARARGMDVPDTRGQEVWILAYKARP